jgi:hypothetical protein
MQRRRLFPAIVGGVSLAAQPFPSAPTQSTALKATAPMSSTEQRGVRRTVNVVDFGADPSLADNTPAFNLATQATAPWSEALEYNIIVPSGKFKLLGTVYVRKGQTLCGEGHGSYIDASGFISTPEDTFVLGSGLIDGVRVSDPGGSPVKISNLRTLGGSGTHSLIYTNAMGFSIVDMFITAPGTAITIEGGDGLLSNIEIDQCLQGISMKSAHNVSLVNFNIYLPNYGIVFHGTCSDVVISNGVIEYTNYASIYFSEGSAEHRSINVSNVNFLENAQYATFTGFVYSRASGVDVNFIGCSFRNMPNWAINQDNGIGTRFYFSECTFDGNKTLVLYEQSGTAKVINTGAGSYDFSGCKFRNLSGEIATVNDGLMSLKIYGGEVVNCPRVRVNVMASDSPKISVKGVSGFALAESDATHQFVVLPYWKSLAGWRVCVQGNTLVGGDENYLSVDEAVYTVSFQYDGTVKQLFADKVQTWKSIVRNIPVALNATVRFGVAPRGAAVLSSWVPNGYVCISVAVPRDLASGFDWDVETVM